MDLRSGRRFVPSSENQASQVCRIGVLDRGPPVTRQATVASPSDGPPGFMIVHHAQGPVGRGTPVTCVARE